MDLLRKFHNNIFAGCFENVTKAAKTVYEWSIQKAVTEESAKNNSLLWHFASKHLGIEKTINL